MTVGANESTPLVSTPAAKSQGDVENQRTSPTGVDDPHLQQPEQFVRKEDLQQYFREKDSSRQTCRDNFSFYVGLIFVFFLCLLLAFVLVVLLSKQEDKDALAAFVGENWPWVVFSSFATALLWIMKSGQAALQQKMESGQAALQQNLDGITTMIKRHHEENNLVMSATHLVQSVTPKIDQKD